MVLFQWVFSMMPEKVLVVEERLKYFTFWCSNQGKPCNANICVGLQEIHHSRSTARLADEQVYWKLSLAIAIYEFRQYKEIQRQITRAIHPLTGHHLLLFGL